MIRASRSGEQFVFVKGSDRYLLSCGVVLSVRVKGVIGRCHVRKLQ